MGNNYIKMDTEQTKEILLAIITVITSLALVVLSIGVGWFIMWKLFLSRFQFVREILSADSEQENLRQRQAQKRKIRRD
jgi:hypothetical protein